MGKFLGIRAGETLLIGVITNVSIETSALPNGRGSHSTADLDLVGEIKPSATGQAQFQRGVTEYPAIGDPSRPSAPASCGWYSMPPAHR